MKVQDGKHFLKFYITDDGMRGEVLCTASPQHDVKAACRYGGDKLGEPAECWVRYEWDNLNFDILKTPHHAIDRLLVWTSPLPIVYEGEGSGEDYEGWIYPDLDNRSSPATLRELRDKVLRDEA